MPEKPYVILGARVVAAMGNFPGWKNLPTEAEKAWRPYIRQAPLILMERLDNPLTLAELFAAKVDWVNFMLGKGVLRNIYGVFRETQQARIARQMQADLVLFDLSITDLPAALNRLHEHGQAYREFIQKPLTTSPQQQRVMLKLLGLSGEALQAFDEDRLTVKGLLTLQPWLILSV